jgi:hypothetical protein
MSPQQTHQEMRMLDPIPAGFTPEGIPETRLEELFDENTRYLLQALPSRYQAIFVHLLRYATLDPRSSMQLSLFKVLGESRDEAIILYKSVEKLAKMANSPAGPETYLKALLIYEALHILRRKFHRGYTEIRIPLGKREIRIPELLHSLHQLHSGYDNRKVKQLAHKVALVLRSPAWSAGIPRPFIAVDAQIQAILTRLLQEHGIEESQIRRAELLRTCTALAQEMSLGRSGRVPAYVGELAAPSGRLAPNTGGDSLPAVGVFSTSVESQTPAGQWVKAGRSGESAQTESPSKKPKRGKHPACALQTGELDPQMGEESPEIGPNLPETGQEGDSLPPVSISDSLSFKISLEKEETLIDTPTGEMTNTPTYVDPRPHREIGREVQVYKNLFDRGPGRKWDGALYNAVKFTPPQTRRLAAIGAILYRQFRQPDGSLVRVPGAWFTSACKRYQTNDAEIPAELYAWDATALPLDEIEKQIRQGKRHPAQMTFPFSAYALASPTLNVPGRSELPVAPRPQGELCTWMNQAEAEALCQRIEQEAQRFAVRARVRPDTPAGVFVVVTNWGGVLESHATAGEWDQYFADTRACLEGEPA